MSTEQAVATLVNGRQSERMAVQLELERDDGPLNRELARQLILTALAGPCAPLPGKRQEDDTFAGARCWLLGSLAFVNASPDGLEPEQTLRRFVELDHEWNWWARYWALQALHLRRPADLLDVCKHIATDEHDVLPRSLSVAILAKAGDEPSIEEIKGILGHTKHPNRSAVWGVLRALRFVYLPFAVHPVCEIVQLAAKHNRYSDETFDAIVALGKVDPSGKEAQAAVNALSAIIVHARQFQYWDVMRIRAIEALAQLRVAHTAALLLDEVTDLNPSVVKAAALALEPVLGAKVTVTRVLERLCRDEDADTSLPLYASALRFLEDDTAVVTQLAAAMGAGTPDSRDYARRLLGEVGGSSAIDLLTARAKGAERFVEVLNASDEKLQRTFEETLREGQSAFGVVLNMDIWLFRLGLGLLLLSVGVALIDESLIATMTASGGVLSALYGRFIAKPRQQIEASVTHLATLKTIFLGYLRQLHQVDQAYARRMLEDEAPDADTVAKFTDLVRGVMADALAQLGHHEAVQRLQRAPAGGDSDGTDPG